MSSFSVNQVSFDRASVIAVAAGAVSTGRSQAATDEPPPWPLVVVLPLIAGLSVALWAGIGRLLGMFITG